MRQYEIDEDEDGPYVVIEKHSGGGLGNFFVGLAIGAGLALLFAPQSGEETRRGIKRRARTARDTVQGAVTDAADAVADTFHDARRRVEDRLDDARRAVDMKREQVTRAVEAGRAAAQAARDELERRIAETKTAYRTGAEGARPRRATTEPATVTSSVDDETEET